MALAKYFKINGVTLKENRKTEIEFGRNIIEFDGYVLLKISKEPMIDVAPEKAAGAALATCITVLPLCPVNLMLLNVAIGKTKTIEKKCFGRLEFFARRDEYYSATLEETSNIEPKIKVFLESYSTTIAEEQIQCEGIDSLKVGAQERT